MKIFLIEQEYDVEPNSSVCSAWSTRELARAELKRRAVDYSSANFRSEDEFEHDYGRLFVSEIPLDHGVPEASLTPEEHTRLAKKYVALRY